MSELSRSNENSVENLSFLERAAKEIWRDTDKFFDNFASEYMSMFERACGLFFVAKIDDQLSELIKDFFVDNKSSTKEILEGMGALASFSAQIELAFLLGLISIRERNILNLLRKIRNDFAHCSSIVSFDQSPVKDRCLELKVERIWGKRKKEEKATGLSEEIGKFITACEYLILILAYRRDRLDRQSEAEPITEENLTLEIKKMRTRQS